MAKTTKYKLAEQAQRILLSGHVTDDREISLQELLLHVAQTFAYAVRTRFFESKAIGEEHVNGVYVYAFEDVAVKKDSKKNLYYSLIPASYIDLPRDLGVFQVSLMEDQENVFVPVPNGFLGLYRGMAAANLQGRSGYWVESGRIYFVNVQDPTCKVLMKLVASIADVDEDTEIDIPDDIQNMIVRSTVELYIMERQAMKDLTSDNIE